MREPEYTTVEEHEHQALFGPAQTPYEVLVDIRQMSREHIAAARRRIDRSRQRLERDGQGRATQEQPAPAPRPNASPEQPRGVTAAPIYWCPQCLQGTPTPAHFCRHCGEPVVSEITTALIRSGRRAFASAVVAFSAFMEQTGTPVAPFWREILAALSDPALSQQDVAAIRRWYTGLGRDYDLDHEASRRSGLARLEELLRR